MKKLTHRLAAASSLAILLAAPGCAQQTTPTPVQSTQVAAEQMELDGPALWKVADEDTTIYLFGTVHALRKDVDWFKPGISDALKSSDKLVTEVMMTPETPQKMQALVMGKGILPQGTTLRSLMDDEERATYENALTAIDMPVEAFDMFEPWYAAMMLSILPLMKDGYDLESGVEQILTKAAGDKPKGELETLEFQIGVFDGMSMENQLKFLLETAGSVEELPEMLDMMVAEWMDGDADELGRLMNESLSDPAFAEALLYNRNQNWAVWIDDRLDQPGTVFIAVGAGHLAGEKSVQDLLAVRGIKTQRVQ